MTTADSKQVQIDCGLIHVRAAKSAAQDLQSIPVDLDVRSVLEITGRAIERHLQHAIDRLEDRWDT